MAGIRSDGGELTTIEFRRKNGTKKGDVTTGVGRNRDSGRLCGLEADGIPTFGSWKPNGRGRRRNPHGKWTLPGSTGNGKGEDVDREEGRGRAGISVKNANPWRKMRGLFRAFAYKVMGISMPGKATSTRAT